MATGNIKGGRRNYARPTTPSTSSLAASTTQAVVSYSLTPSTLGPTATSYVITGTSNDGGANTSVVVTATSGTLSQFDLGKTYSLNLAAQNYNGLGAATGNTTVVVPTAYALAVTANATTSYVIPSSITKIAGIVVSTGGEGASGGNTGNNNGGGGGGGGGSGALVGFWEFAVTSGNTVTLTVGSANAATKVTYGGVDIATANQGSTATAGSGNTAGAGGAGGNASTNISTNSITVNGNAGGVGGTGIQNQGTGNDLPAVGNTVTPFSTTSFSFAPASTVTVTLGSGGGGGAGGRYINSGNNSLMGQAGAAGGTNGGAGGLGSGNSGGNAGAAATNFGSGGGGGGGSGSANPGGLNSATGGGAAGAARIYLYTKV